MTTRFKPNIDGKGRFARAVWGTVVIGLGVFAGLGFDPWLGGALVLFGGFAWCETARGWCVMRACGIKTRW